VQHGLAKTSIDKRDEFHPSIRDIGARLGKAGHWLSVPKTKPQAGKPMACLVGKEEIAMICDLLVGLRHPRVHFGFGQSMSFQRR
jgi:hypothetical protein